ncbi:MAG: outer membrane protein assembly factor BamA [Pelagibacteraceae bacterium]|nr:outer membrane protein assembly factor BamA [Pelagibacteraceae bacterium]
MNIKKIIIYIVLFISIYSISFSKGIIIQNNERLSFNDINSLTSYDLNLNDITSENINIIIKELLDSELIYNVELNSDLNNFYLLIKESFFVNEVYINGNIKVKDDDILNNISIKNKSYVNNDIINKNIQIIENIYSFKGQPSALITSYFEEFSNNSFNLIFDIKEDQEKFITKITFLGNEFLSQRFLKSIISSKEKKIFAFLSSVNFINESKIKTDINTIKNKYRDLGFLDININYEINENNNNYKLKFFIEEGNRYLVNDIEFLDNQFVNLDTLTTSQIKTINKIKENFYDGDKISLFIEDVNNTLYGNNLSYVSLSESFIKINENKVDLLFRLEEKKINIVDKINIFGNSITKDETLRKQVFIKPGDVYSDRKIKKTKEKLIKNSYIDNVTISSNNKEDYATDLDILVSEKQKTGSFSFGAGFSGSTGVGTNISLSDSNFYGTGNKLKVSAQLGSKSALYDINYRKFFFFDKNLENGYKIYNKSEDLKKDYGYKKDSTGFGFDITIPYKYDYNKKQYFGLGLFYEQLDLYDLNSTATSVIKQNSGKSNNLVFESSFITDSRNNRFNPTKGSYNANLFELSPTGVSDSDFIKISSVNNFYYKAFKTDNSFFILSKVGIASGLDKKLKTSNSFSMGGSDFKGFQYSGIGPRDSSKNYLGASKTYLLTVGYSSPFLFDDSDTLILKYFATIGSNYSSEYTSSFDSSSPRASFGFSADMMTPIGPLTMSLAKPLVKKSYDKTQTFDFSIGTAF